MYCCMTYLVVFIPRKSAISARLRGIWQKSSRFLPLTSLSARGVASAVWAFLRKVTVKVPRLSSSSAGGSP